MAGIKIIDLPPVPSAEDSDVFPISQSGTTYKESNSQLISLFQSHGQTLSSTNDTNVTVTLGGSPAIALLNSASLTMGWTGQLSVARGGIGLSATTPNAVLCGGTTSTGPLQSIASVGTSGQILTSNGAGALPTFQSFSGSGTVNSGSINQMAWYAANGTAVSGLGTSASGVLVTSAGSVPSISTTLPNGLTMGTPASLTLTNATGLVPSSGLSATGTPSSSTFLRGDNTWSTVSSVTPAALTEIDDTNVTMTLGGTPGTALLQATSMTLGWSGQLAIARGGTGVGSVTTVPTVSAWAGWDTNSNLSANNFINGYVTTPTAAGTTTLAFTSPGLIFFTGTMAQTVVLPVSANCVLGQTWTIVNLSSGTLLVNTSGGTNVLSILGKNQGTFTCILASGTGTASWGCWTGSGSMISSTIPSGSGISLTSTVAADITTISVPRGDWLFTGNVNTFGTASTTFNYCYGWVNVSAATIPNADFLTGSQFAGALLPSLGFGAATCPLPITLNSTTTIRLSCQASFAVSTATACGFILATRLGKCV